MEAASDSSCLAWQAARLLARGEGRLTAIAYAERALRDLRCRDHDGCVFYALMTLLCGNKFKLAALHCEKLAALPAWSPGTASGRLLAALRARIQHLSGHPTCALESFARSAQVSDGHPPNSIAVAWEAEASIDAGDPQRALSILRRHGSRGEGTGDLPDSLGGGRVLLLAARAAAHVAMGEYSAGIRDYRACGRYLVANQLHNPSLLPWHTNIGLAAMELGDDEQARQFVAIGMRAARRWGAASEMGRALYAAVRLSGHRDITDVAREAVDLLRVSGAVCDLLRITLLLGKILADRQQLSLARRFFHEAIATGTQYRNHDIVRKATSALDEIGAPRLLTSQEFKIIRLAAMGYNNDAIARSLILARRTVEVHLSSAYEKLKLSGRRELADCYLVGFGQTGLA
jgi:DNA-binding CsgD family transcriptional regulator